MEFVLLHCKSLFASPANREESEEKILDLLGWLANQDLKYLRRHPETKLLYESGVTYAWPEQMEECRIPEAKIGECRRYLASIGAGEETVDVVEAFLRGVEHFRDTPALYAKGAADCDNLAAARLAELWRAGIPASPYITWRETPQGTTYHALIRHPDGTSEDPSRILGLGTPAEWAEEKRKNRERHDTFVAAAQQLCLAGEMTVAEAKRKIALLGFVPSDGRW